MVSIKMAAHLEPCGVLVEVLHVGVEQPLPLLAVAQGQARGTGRHLTRRRQLHVLRRGLAPAHTIHREKEGLSERKVHTTFTERRKGHR
jgi:hypothetical protein